MNTKKELLGIELQAYLQASKKKKGEILDSLSRQTGMWRESIMRRFKRFHMESAYVPKKKRGRSVYYTPDAYAGLKEVWEAANSCCGELLHPIISEYILIFKKDKIMKRSKFPDRGITTKMTTDISSRETDILLGDGWGMTD